MLQNLDRLKVFYHVYHLGSVVGAAQFLHVSQSAVSQTVQKLEKEVGSPLFVRLHKQLVPTTAGDDLFKLLQPFMLQLDSYIKDCKLAKDIPMGELRLGAPPEFGKNYLPSVVADFRKRYSDVTFVLEFGTPDKLLPMLKGGIIDFALVDVFLTKRTEGVSLDIYHFNPVLEEEVVLACSRPYYDTHIRGDHSYATISNLDFISYQKDQQTIKKWFRHHFSKPNVQVGAVLVVDSHEAVIGSIKKDIGLGIIASHLVQNAIDNGEIVPIKKAKTEILNPIALVHLQDKIPTLTEKVFGTYMVKKIKAMIAASGDGMKIVVP